MRPVRHPHDILSDSRSIRRTFDIYRRPSTPSHTAMSYPGDIMEEAGVGDQAGAQGRHTEGIVARSDTELQHEPASDKLRCYEQTVWAERGGRAAAGNTQVHGRDERGGMRSARDADSQEGERRGSRATGRDDAATTGHSRSMVPMSTNAPQQEQAGMEGSGGHTVLHGNPQPPTHPTSNLSGIPNLQHKKRVSLRVPRRMQRFPTLSWAMRCIEPRQQ